MAYRRLIIQHPHDWIESSLPEKHFEFCGGKWQFVGWTPSSIAPEYEKYFLGLLASHALWTLNGAYPPNDWEETEGELRAQLYRYAIAAGKRAGIIFIARRPNAVRTLDGLVSTRWLRRAVATAARFACDEWDPAVARVRRDEASKRGQKSRRGRLHSSDDLPAGSIKAQAEALGVSRRTISRMRRDVKVAV